MPEKPVAFFQIAETQEILTRWLDEKWPKNRRVCTICENSNWHIEPDAGMLLVYRGNQLNLNSGFPLVLINCTNCSFVHIFNAAKIGLLPQQDGEKEADDGK